MRKHLLSQHFLKSPRIALFLIGHSNIRKRDVVLEIGAGSGVITSALSYRAKEVIALEPDKDTAKKLRENLSKRNIENVKVLETTIEDFDLNTLPEGYKVFSNPPFSHSSIIIHKFLEATNQPKSFYLILQKQFALKMIPTDRHYTSQLGYELQKSYDVKIKYPLKPTDFTPPPAVPTVLLEAKRRQETTSNTLSQ